MTLPDSGYWPHSEHRGPCLLLWLVVGAVIVGIPAGVLFGAWSLLVAAARWAGW